jgi:hypothetical protein
MSPAGPESEPDNWREPCARATSFFRRDDCGYVTGQILLVDGGVSATF